MIMKKKGSKSKTNTADGAFEKQGFPLRNNSARKGADGGTAFGKTTSRRLASGPHPTPTPPVLQRLASDTSAAGRKRERPARDGTAPAARRPFSAEKSLRFMTDAAEVLSDTSVTSAPERGRARGTAGLPPSSLKRRSLSAATTRRPWGGGGCPVRGGVCSGVGGAREPTASSLLRQKKTVPPAAAAKTAAAPGAAPARRSSGSRQHLLPRHHGGLAHKKEGSTAAAEAAAAAAASTMASTAARSPARETPADAGAHTVGTPRTHTPRTPRGDAVVPAPAALLRRVGSGGSGRGDPQMWTVEQVAAYLRAVNLSEQNVQCLEKERVNGLCLLNLTKRDITEHFGITQFSERKTLETVSAQLRQHCHKGNRSTPAVSRFLLGP